MQEGTPRTNASGECAFPGCDGNDFIHDDVTLENIIAHEKIGDYGIAAAKFSRNQVDELSELDYALFPTYVQGYVLNNRVWAKLEMDLITDIPRTDSMFDALHIPGKHKEALTALVKICGTRAPGQSELDVIPGKGRGIIILLHGKPGLGKTATAEAMAAKLKRPLYPITYADLGDGPSAIETNLKKIFRYGQRWKCVLLLDEADVFLMPRDKEDTKRNSIVSIFLRNMEWYPGIIFLTTNRLDQFDEGVLDRVHLKLHYPQLNERFTERIFNDHFKRINDAYRAFDESSMHGHETSIPSCQVKKADMAKIQEWRKNQHEEAGDGSWWNGRQIRNAFQMATGFAEQERDSDNEKIATIKRTHFKRISDFYDGFQKDLQDAQDGMTDDGHPDS